MSEPDLSSKWIKLASRPQPCWRTSAPTQINNKEFARFNCDPPYAVKYNIDLDRWDKLATYQSLLQKGYDITSAFDMKNQVLYIQCGSHMIEINVETNKTKTTQHTTHIGHSARAIIINGEFHIIGGCKNTKHFIWNSHGETFETQYDFSEIIETTEWQYFAQCEVVQISPTQLLCLGGFASCHCTDTILSYDITNKKWNMLTQKLPKTIFLFGCVVSRDKQYVIILGGSYRDTIYVLDLKMMQFRESSIHCPKKECFQAINMYDEKRDNLLCFGYIREVCDLLYMPFYLMKMVGKYYSNEWIYLMEQESKDHWKIKLDYILMN